MKHILDLFDSDGVIAVMRDEVRKFARSRVAPRDADDRFPEPLWREMGEQGLLGVTVPESDGGLGLGYLAHAVFAEELSRASGSIGLSYIAHSNLCVNQIALNGSPEQRSRYLPGLMSGTQVGALAMSEAGAGSDIMSMRTFAARAEGGFVLDGAKMWITNGGRADVVLVYAKTDKEHNRLTAFLVDKGTPGFAVGQSIHKIGMRASETVELVFERCFVPDSAVVGEVDRGVAVLMSGLNFERLILAAGALGLAQAALDEATSYVRERKQFGQPIGGFQSVAFALAQATSDIDCVRAYIHSTAAGIDAAGPSAKADRALRERCAGVFLQGGQLAERVSALAVKLLGGNGYTTEYKVGRIWQDAMLYQIGGGTENIRLHMLAKSLDIGY